MLLYRGIVAAAYVIFACNVAISYYHALEWFREIGDFPGIFAHLAVIGVDTVFAVSSVVISTGITRRIRLGFPVWLCFLFGLLVTGWSNVRACLHDQEEGIIAGLAIPAALLCIKLLLSWMTSNKILFATFFKMENAKLERVKNLATDKMEKVEGRLEKTSPINPETPPMELEEQTKEKTTPQWVETLIHHQDLGELSKIKTPVKLQERTSDLNTPIKPKESRSTKAEELTQETPPAKLQEATPMNTEEPSITMEVEEKVMVESGDEMEMTPLDWAILLHQKDGELPSRKKLMEVAGVSEWIARKTIGELKKKIG